MQIITWLQQHSIIIMLVFFTAVVAVAYAPSQKSKSEANGTIPLRDDP